MRVATSKHKNKVFPSRVSSEYWKILILSTISKVTAAVSKCLLNYRGKNSHSPMLINWTNIMRHNKWDP
jgi:hypothetical protein